ncbi:MAG: winged helix DNA-binding protein [Aureispira sp.]|nr:winged helix DNA-binding protein [Aureispira sp.]
MGIQQDIKIKEFKSSFQKAIVNIFFTSNWLRDQQAHIYKTYGLLPQHYNVLRIIKGRNPESISPGEILDVMIDKGRDLTRLVDKLVKKGLVKRHGCPINRRKVNIYVTPKGVKLSDEIEGEMAKWAKQFANIPEEDAEQLSLILDKLRTKKD